MANKQYIGARYVPLIDGEWNENKAYEPLTVVTYLTNSYTSKKFVPAGTLPTDTTYWVLTGNYNGMIGQLSDRIGVVEGDVSDLKGAVDTLEDVTIPNLETAVTEAVGKRERNLAGRKFIIIGDSYGGLGWTTNVATRLDLDAHVINIGGAGFYGAGGGQTFKDGLQAYAETLTADERAEVTDIIVGGGVNDYNETTGNITSAVNSYIAYAHTAFPNAMLGVACVSWMRRSNDIVGYVEKVIPAYRARFTAYAYTYYIPNAYLPMHDYTNIDSDGVHPKASGTAAITDFMCQYLLKGSTDYEVINSVQLTAVTGVTYSSAPFFKCEMNAGGVDVTFGGADFSFNTAVALDGGNDLHHFGTINGGCINGLISSYAAGLASICVPVTGSIITDSGTRTRAATFLISIYDGYVDISGTVRDPAADTYVSASRFILDPMTFHAGILSS